MWVDILDVAGSIQAAGVGILEVVAKRSNGLTWHTISWLIQGDDGTASRETTRSGSEQAT